MDLSALFSSSGTESVTLSLGNTILILLAPWFWGHSSVLFTCTHTNARAIPRLSL